MTITPNYTNSGITLQYSLDTINWVNITAKAVTPSANVIYFRGSATGTKSLFVGTGTGNAWIFTGATNLEVNGDITMLIQDNLGDMVSDIPLANYGYSNMLQGCTSLTTAPELPATTLANNCYSGMLKGCTGLTTPPVLPVTTLVNGCYSGMLEGCTGLTTTPELPATTLASDCYSYMFFGCTKIKVSTALTGIYDTAYRIPITGEGTTAYDALGDMFLGTGGTFTGTPEINTTYYTENTPV